MSIGEYGNTSSASIPLTICVALQEQIKNQQLTMLFSGFGVGLSWANVLLKVGPIKVKTIEYD
jgi:3-oxoacyl-[acyl-carrier-protein] synthase-3